MDEWLDLLLRNLEGENLEFKEARSSYSLEKLSRYCGALANEGGGKVVLGVTDARPRRVVGTRAFEQLERTRAQLLEKVHLRITVEEIQRSEGRVLVFSIPPRPVGVPIPIGATLTLTA